ncbi:hypothetical protein ASE06_07095 [Sphingopyxis sp. Root214]|uniref:S41 family peptidase n=1 Tax=unclassified Sphingopyxis TaxID=2614943 RepID=UPI0006F8CFD6|nr:MULTISPECIES: S41 family peptidase [unclassified Sphingopyxis]KQZ76512.1 hypothetical protein ASD73_00900 [Sphingopyxis sp. Root154]KRC09601.1 hypothetical protein ASE06_07095 [Sphingopyxis sp. Root214]
MKYFAALAAALLLQAPAAAMNAEQRTALLQAADLVAERYVDPVKARAIAEALRRDARDDRNVATLDDEAFAKKVTERLRTISGDGHFALSVRADAATPQESQALMFERWYGAGVNHGFDRVARLESGIGYLNLTAFAPVEMGGDLAASAMNLLAQSPALIVDLRGNSGGMDEMVLLLSAYLLDESREMSATYDRPSGRTTRHFTPSWVSGRRFGGTKPLYILVSRRTFSAAEQFAYDLQAMKRAIIVGERTGGGAHPYEDRAVGNKFVLALPEGRSINPITGSDWEGRGVLPDKEVPADTALEAALTAAREQLATSASR